MAAALTSKHGAASEEKKVVGSFTSSSHWKFQKNQACRMARTGRIHVPWKLSLFTKVNLLFIKCKTGLNNLGRFSRSIYTVDFRGLLPAGSREAVHLDLHTSQQGAQTSSNGPIISYSIWTWRITLTCSQWWQCEPTVKTNYQDHNFVLNPPPNLFENNCRWPRTLQECKYLRNTLM